MAVTADPSEVLVGNEVTLTATVTGGDPLAGGWFHVCPGDGWPPPTTEPAEPLTKTVCCGRVGIVEHGYAAEFADGTDRDATPVTVVGPDNFSTIGFNTDSFTYGNGVEAAVLATYLTKNGQTVGTCADVQMLEVLVLQWDDAEGEYVQSGDWISPATGSVRNGSRGMSGDRAA